MHRVAELAATVDAGEAEAIMLALELHADVLLIDERKGRRLATGLGLRPVGVLRVLADAKLAGLIPLVCPVVAELQRRIGIRIDDRVLRSFRELVGE